MNKKRADQLENGDMVLLEHESRRHIALVNGVLQFRNEPGKTTIGLLNVETNVTAYMRVPSSLLFEIILTN